MTPIQALSLPHIIDGTDVIAKGKTGSGKTAAFGLGVLNKLNTHSFKIQTLILCPTRELADQVAGELRKLGRAIPNIKILTLCGGKPFGTQASSLEHGAHIIVGTPGRIEDHLNRKTLSLASINTLVLDEADRMLDMGFQAQLDKIIGQLPRQRQTLLFSATFTDQIKQIANKVMNKPTSVEAESDHNENTINQVVYELTDEVDRFTATKLILLHYKIESVVIFCATKRETKELAQELNRFGFRALALHGDLEQRDRDQTLLRFANKSTSILVATDVASRGLDIDSVDLIINYHIAHDADVHVHRVGRTGRAGSTGTACTLFDSKEAHKIERLEAFLGHPLKSEKLPNMSVLKQDPIQPTMVTLLIDGGKKQKVRRGDILGALTAKDGVTGSQVGKIDLLDLRSYVAVERLVANKALDKLNNGKLKGKRFRARRL